MGIADVYRALWRHKYFILVLTACLVAAAWYLTSRQQQIYESETLVRVVQRVDDPDQAAGLQALETAERLARTYANIAQTDNIAQRVARATDLPISAVKISADPVRDLELLWIRARSPSPQRAADVANAAPRALQSFIRQTGTPSERVITVEPASLPTEPASPRLMLNLVLAGLLGLIFNGALALLIEVLGDRVRDADELERLTGQPILTTVPKLHFHRHRLLAEPEPRPGAAARPPDKALGRATGG